MPIWPFRKRDLSLGQQGEALAVRYLKHRGLKILARNYRCPVGEIDIIAFDKDSASHFGEDCVVFAEVKTRTSDTYTSPAAAVDEDKQRRIKRTAAYYLTRHRAGNMRVRYDIISVVLRRSDEPQIRHITAAF